MWFVKQAVFQQADFEETARQQLANNVSKPSRKKERFSFKKKINKLKSTHQSL